MRTRETNICYVIGNHDDFMENFRGLHFGNMEVCQKKIHTSLNNKNYLVKIFSFQHLAQHQEYLLM